MHENSSFAVFYLDLLRAATLEYLLNHDRYTARPIDPTEHLCDVNIDLHNK